MTSALRLTSACTTSAPPEALDRALDLAQGVGLLSDIVEHQVEAGTGETECDGSSNAAARSGDERAPPVRYVGHDCLSLRLCDAGRRYQQV